MSAIIDHLYGQVVDKQDEFTRSQLLLPSSVKGAELMRYQIDLFVTADKYGVRSLRDHLLKIFPGNLTMVTDFMSYPKNVDEIARHLYIEHKGCIEALQQVVVTSIVTDIHKFSDEAEFKRLLIDVPELAADLVHTMVKRQPPVRDPTMKTMIKEGTPVKRQRVKDGRKSSCTYAKRTRVGTRAAARAKHVVKQETDDEGQKSDAESER